MELKAEELARLKELEFEILVAFDQVCKTLGLKYYLLGGTLLGAVRHKGFIPWDDDIDVGMLREDYEVFIAKAQELLPEHLFVQNLYTDPEYPANFTKIRNSNTTFVEASSKNIDMNHGVYIDVFPLDFYPDTTMKQRMLDLKNRFFVCGIAPVFYLPDMVYSWKAKLITAIMRELYRTTNNLVRGRERLLKSVKSGKYLANYCGAWGKKEIVPQEWYGEGVELEFEGLITRGPKCYHEWLTQVYGDYMQLPPVEKRKGHHYTEYFDLDRPYTEYVGG